MNIPSNILITFNVNESSNYKNIKSCFKGNKIALDHIKPLNKNNLKSKNLKRTNKNFLSNFLILDKEFNLKEVYLRGKKINYFYN